MSTQPPNKDQKKYDVNDEELKKFNEEMILSTLITPDRLYVDLRLLKDFNIGCLLSFLKERKDAISPEEYTDLYKKILDNLPEYNKRKYDDIEHLFPFMGVTNAQMQERMADEKYAPFIFQHAPTTKFLDSLKAQIFVNVNHSAVAGKRNPIEIAVNTYPLKVDELGKKVTGIYLSHLLGVNIQIVYLDPKSWKLKDIKIYDEIYTYYLKEYFDAEDIRYEYSSMKFLNKRLFAAKIFGSKFVLRHDTDREEIIIKTRLDISTQFLYLNPHLFSAPPPKIDKETTADG